DLDEIEMSIFGNNTGATGTISPDQDGQNWGQFRIEEDNAFIAEAIAGKSLADIDLDGVPGTAADATAFETNFGNTKEIIGVRIADLETRRWGDVNFDGTVNLADWALIQTEWPANSPPPNLATIPEPASMMLLVLGGAGMLRRNRR
ncbi:MAG: PEP-CTERM sorting domain-containing protein, partial [Rhodospirillales bacterium]|nr:PEP-CTERM sorting domain-containing protein [Rhodospirillales bacterium]